MITKKFKYFLLIESIKDIDLKNIKIRNKFSIIYRNHSKIDKLNDLSKFRRQCKLKAIKFYIANNNALAVSLNSDGIYLSSFNKKLNFFMATLPRAVFWGPLKSVDRISMEVSLLYNLR